MSVAMICSGSTAVPLPVLLEKEFLMPTPFAPSKTCRLPSGGAAVVKNEEQEEKKAAPAQLDIWTSIQATKAKEPKVDEPYVHPLLRRSSSLMSQRSLEVCTESLGSETGSDEFLSSDDDMEHWFSTRPNKKQVVVQHQQQEEEEEEHDNDNDNEAGEFAGTKWKEQATVNYHCSVSRRSPCRSFPPPLPSISRRDGRCFQMRPRRRDGRLVVEAVAVPSQNYLQAERQDGRLLLSFINTTTRQSNSNTDILTEQTPVEEEVEEEVAEEEEEVMDELEDQEEEEEEEEEEVEVVDRGTVVEVKVSTQPQQQSGGSAAMKVHRSSIVINKFVSCTSSQLNDKENDQNAVNSSIDDYATAAAALRRSANTTTTAAAAAVAASSLSTLPADGSQPSFDNKLLFTSKRRNREELLRDMRRCSQLRKPLFIWEPTCIATSS
ncbi:putative protein FAF-like, chloroplastic [Iris pallida]|uniref:FAF domain-containing protein n=1 Tax=Iris pallida TaxID=29817 RepID=A0AAX6EF43_IRIPA|nr:putative protein FAF-like, chloroplastic [Iris pallida]